MAATGHVEMSCYACILIVVYIILIPDVAEKAQVADWREIMLIL